MLIVIVIIGILAAALIPRLSSARGRANDVARKADLAQTAAALVAYQIDHGRFPTSTGDPLEDISDELIGAGMSSIPSDPNTSREFDGIWTITIYSWQYWYIPIKKWWISNNGFVVMAATETEWWSNWIASSNNSLWSENITWGTAYENIILCKSFVTNSSLDDPANWICYYDEENDVLRYIYIY